MSQSFKHVPVLLNEVLNLLLPERGGIFVDGTLGGGGHAEAVLKRLPKDGRLIGIDMIGKPCVRRRDGCPFLATASARCTATFLI